MCIKDAFNLAKKSVRVKYNPIIESRLMKVKKDLTELCSCKCHYGGAVSCPGCKGNHGIVCCHCNH